MDYFHLLEYFHIFDWNISKLWILIGYEKN